MPLIDDDQPEILVPRLKADLIAWLEECDEDTQGTTLKPLRLRMNEYKRK
jgi:hypothetical protein